MTQKKEFLKVVDAEWSKEVAGYNMYKLVKKLKSLKKPLNKLSWEKGNVYEREEQCRGELKKLQSDMEKDPTNENLRKECCDKLEEYAEAKRDEVSLRVEWLQKGDKNTSYFHKILKGRKHKSRIVEVKDESGQRFENEDVAHNF